jgi:predicted phosphodiesterase
MRKREVNIKAIVADLPADLPYIKLYIISDWHLGEDNCDIDLIIKTVEMIKNDPYAYVIVNGDIFNNATKTSISDTYTETLPPLEQIKLGKRLLEPIKDKILMLNTGNHELRTYKKEGIDLAEILAMELGICKRFGRYGAVLFIRFGTLRKDASRKGNVKKNSYSIYATHGSGGGRREGGKVNRLADLASIVDTDIYIHSHTHMPFVMKNAFLRADNRNGAISIVDKLFVNSGATLNFGGYGQQLGFKPSSKAMPIIMLSGTEKEMTATL